MNKTQLGSGAPDALGRAPSLSDMLSVRLREEIESGRLQRGDRLPTEHQLSLNYGVSRSIVREAVGRLKHDGLVVTRQGAGAFVAQSEVSPVFRLHGGNMADGDELRNIVELLMAVESSATALAAERRNEVELNVIAAKLAAMEEAAQSGESGVDEDIAFHRAIVNASGNPFFRDLSELLDRRVRKFILTARKNSARLAGMAQAVQAEHLAIFAAIEARKPQLARAAAEAHLHNAAKRLTLYLGD